MKKKFEPSNYQGSEQAEDQVELNRIDDQFEGLKVEYSNYDNQAREDTS